VGFLFAQVWLLVFAWATTVFMQKGTAGGMTNRCKVGHDAVAKSVSRRVRRETHKDRGIYLFSGRSAGSSEPSERARVTIVTAFQLLYEEPNKKSRIRGCGFFHN
jgi:hypothetical protein